MDNNTAGRSRDSTEIIFYVTDYLFKPWLRPCLGNPMTQGQLSGIGHKGHHLPLATITYQRKLPRKSRHFPRIIKVPGYLQLHKKQTYHQNTTHLKMRLKFIFVVELSSVC